MYLKDKDPKLLQRRRDTGTWGTLKSYRSLFETIPSDRGCDGAGIPVHFCTCHTWTSVSANDRTVQMALQAFVSWANGLLESRPHDVPCGHLSLQAGNWTQAWALEGKHPEAVSLGRKTDRHGRKSTIRATAGSAQHTHGKYFKILVTLQAEGKAGKVIRSDMKYEVVVIMRNENIERAFTVKSANRLDKYGKDPDCVAKEYPFMRKFCKCEI